MPQAPRWNKRAQRIVIELIGEPSNDLSKETKKQRKVKKQLLNEEGQWVR